DAISEAWARYVPAGGPRMLMSQISDRLADLEAAVAADRPAQVHRAALDVAEAGLDLQLRYRPPAEVDRDRLRVRASHLLVDAAAGDPEAVDGDVVVLDALLARIGPPAGPAGAMLASTMSELRAAAAGKDLIRAATAAEALAKP
ncbi:MAG: hypothetical protein WKF86_01010, partial [Acidimicrobiales bacterium]